MKYKLLFILMISVVFSGVCYAREDTKVMDESLYFYNFDREVVSASKFTEKTSEAPATVIVVTQNDIRLRGYNNLIDVLKDLPGMDVVTSYGDDYVKNYWRGYRNVISAAYLLMIDGAVFNHLYLNSTDILAAFPLSNIDKIEFVYGPVSSVYGANAFMGVINVITINDSEKPGSKITSNISYGSNNRSISDINMFYKKEDIRLSFTARFENGNLRDDGVHDNFEWTKNKYYADRSLWGGFVDNSNLAGKFSSPVKNRGMDLRIFAGETEFAAQYFALNSGYGYVYPADKGQNHGIWNRVEQSFYLRHTSQIDSNIASKTLIRYRSSDIENDSYFVENYNGWVDFSFWQSLNSSWALYQDFEVTVNDQLSLFSGIKYEEIDSQKAYDINYGPSVLPGALDPTTYLFPSTLSDVKQYKNRIMTDNKGVYVQGKYLLNETQIINLGVRLDDNCHYGRAITLRASYIHTLGDLTAKILYGDAFQEPSARQLFGAWTGTGSDPSLSPEKSKTFELNLTYKKEQFSHILSLYKVQNTDTILSLAAGARNVGQRDVFGTDYHLQKVFDPGYIKQINVWGYYSYIWGEGDEVYNSATDSYDKAEIGDLANHKIYLGATGHFNDKLTATVKGRYIGERDTVNTNPIDKVDSFFLLDLNVIYTVVKSLGVSLRADNVLDTKYFHPGVRSANSGDSVSGSQGWFNSLIPQPGRTVWVSLDYSY